ncbi:30S ribosomal protein S6 [Leptolyngbya sp. PCC 6406]|uniref:30S ribosomal protein S6 n=1 Tax=Leptolyngbya sp. PCC 6406 TaxID=1173264 RepID=UPI0002ABC712|nr:30S ribosomal protein S6 [Leptolyngbya sp. PCC 6406]
MSKKFLYETMYILRPDIGEEAVDEAIGKFQAIVQEQDAEILETQHRGKRRLAYDIQKHREGIYIQMDYVGPGKVVAVLERAMRLSEVVLRYLTVKQDVDAPEVEDLPVDASDSVAPPVGAA